MIKSHTGYPLSQTLCVFSPNVSDTSCPKIIQKRVRERERSWVISRSIAQVYSLQLMMPRILFCTQLSILYRKKTLCSLLEATFLSKKKAQHESIKMREQFRFYVFHCYTNLIKTVIISLGTHGSQQKYKSNNKHCFNSICYVTIYVMRIHYCDFH